MKHVVKLRAWIILLMCFNLSSIGCQNRNDRSHRLRLSDAHVHLTFYGESAFDSLNKYGVTLVRDCGGDINLLKRWRKEIEVGTRKGPEIIFSGPMIDGRKDLNNPYVRIAVYTSGQAKDAVDSLKALGVDFIKTHTSISPECYFAVLKEARIQNLKVVSHMSLRVPVWIAADSGVNCIEHAAESFIPSPMAAGFVKTSGDTAINDAIDWWRSSAGDSVINHLGRLKIYFTPTLTSYRTFALNGESQDEIDGRLKVLTFLQELTFRLNKAGVIILAGSDLSKPPPSVWSEIPGKSILQEIELLEQAGLTKKEALAAASINLETWKKMQSNR
jgi:hypothetical protein